MSGWPAVETRALVKLFGATPALLRVDLTVPRGSVCAVVGGNGAGKSTLLRVLATVVRPTSGAAWVNGRNVVAEADDVRRCVDLLPATGGLYAELSAVENLRFALQMRGVAATRSELLASLTRVGLGPVADDRAGTYSTGMLRRLGLARVRLTAAPVLLLDEPYGGLDEEGRQLVDELLAVAPAAARTVIVATHERDRVCAVADRVERLDRGVVVPVAAPPRAATADMPRAAA